MKQTFYQKKLKYCFNEMFNIVKEHTLYCIHKTYICQQSKILLL